MERQFAHEDPKNGAIEVKLQKKRSEPEAVYWKRVIEAMKVATTQRKTKNGIILSPQLEDECDKQLSLPKKLSETNVTGLRLGYKHVGRVEIERLPKTIPNLTFLELSGNGREMQLPSKLSELLKLQILRIVRFRINADDFINVPQSVGTLVFENCIISDIPELPTPHILLDSLSFAGSQLEKSHLEKIVLVAPWCKTLNMSSISLVDLPYCLAKFENLEVLDLSGNPNLDRKALKHLAPLKHLLKIHLPMTVTDFDISMLPENISVTYEET